MAPATFSVPGTYASVDDYFKVRESLISAERRLGYEGQTQRTALEARAEEVVRRLKSWEENNHHGVRADGSGIEAGHRFLHGMESVAKSKLLEISLKAPKGALLHSHFDAMLPPEPVLAEARQQDRLYIATNAPLTCKEFFSAAMPTFNVFADDKPPSNPGDAFSLQYAAGSWMKYSEFLARFPGGVKGAEAWLSKRMVLQTDDAYHPRQTVDGIWVQFNRSVRIIRSLLCYERAYRGHFRRMLWEFAKDGLSHAEIRFGLDYNFSIKSDDGTREFGVPEIVKMLWETHQEELPKIQAAGFKFHSAKIIYACMRSASREAMQWCMDTCIQVKQDFPDLICAFDMHGQEDAGHPHAYWIPELLSMRAKIESLNLDLPFIFHAGETHDHGGETDSNLFDVILLGAKRIGHGFSITKHPLLIQLCKERNIAIETCPISNEVLGLCPTVKSHHLPVLLSNCVPCTISSDDPGAWNSNVISHDFYQAMVASDTMSLLGWKALIEWSIEYSCMSEEVKATVEKEFQSDWVSFCQWIVDQYESILEN